MEWQPIETAPKEEGKDIILLVNGVPKCGCWYVIHYSEQRDSDGRYIDQTDPDEGWCTSDDLGEQPTHWMPLPAAPLPAGYKTGPCNGMNCGCTDGVSHSPECLAQTAATYAGGYFVKASETMSADKIRDIASKYGMFMTVGQYDITKYACEEDFMNCVREILSAAAPQPAPATGDDIPDPHNGVEAVIACLGDDAATLREDYPEIADNMDRAAELLAAHHSQPLDMVSTGDEREAFEAWWLTGSGNRAGVDHGWMGVGRAAWQASAAHRQSWPVLTEWRAAWQENIDATAAYNARVAYARANEGERIGTISCQHEYERMHDARQKVYRMLPALFEGTASAAHRREDQRDEREACKKVLDAHSFLSVSEELAFIGGWNARAAMQRTAAPAQTDGCIICGSNGNGCPHRTPGY